MLILIGGVSGNLGRLLASSALKRGHSVRGLGRDAKKVPKDISDQLEGFVTTADYLTDVPSLDKACAGVDAVICAYSWSSLLLPLDGQLLLLRAAERAGVKIFHGLSWNIDWTQMAVGSFPGYDPWILFKRQADLTSPIKPLYSFIGAFAEAFFMTDAYPELTVREGVLWDNQRRALQVYGSGEEEFDWITLADAAEYTIELVTSDLAEAGGCYHFRSGRASLKTIKEAYEAARGHPPGWDVKLSRDGLEDRIRQRREELGDAGIKEYIGLMYTSFIVNGIGMGPRDDGLKFPAVQKTSMEEFFKAHPAL